MALAYALVHEEDGSFGVSFPDFPGAVTSGRSADDVIRKASAALTFHVAGMVEDGDPLPVLRSLSEIQTEFPDDVRGAALALVPFDLPARAVRVNISIDENLLGAVDRAASAAGQSRSAFLADAARARIRA
jgi:predicted RNase H-like HicB family nuclease